jgi:hypothetical protein
LAGLERGVENRLQIATRQVGVVGEHKAAFRDQVLGYAGSSEGQHCGTYRADKGNCPERTH